VQERHVISLYKVSKYYNKRVPALHEISCIVRRGEFVFVTGASGAGKTTLLKLLYGAERADQGQMVVNGHDLTPLRPRELPKLRRSVGVVYQDSKLIPYRTIFENIALPLRVFGVTEKEVKQRVWSALKEVGLTKKVSDYPPSLSGGEQHRVALARALVGEPDILLADEPTGNLDPDLTLAIMELIGAAHRRGTTVVVATHDKTIIEQLPRRTLTLVRGELVSSGG
jgi:cell division transport system ATP-binding protein